MFTGIIEEIGCIQNIRQGVHSSILSIEAKKVIEDLKLGDSVAVCGICLTVAQLNKNSFTVDVMGETLNCTNLHQFRRGSLVNLERAMLMGGRLGGHIVSGHVDGIGVIQKIQKEDNAIYYTIQPSKKLLRYMIAKGSVALDGISLTIVSVDQEQFQVSVIPHTAQQTILSQKKVGDLINVETDMIGKYLEKLIAPTMDSSNTTITRDFLLKFGY